MFNRLQQLPPAILYSCVITWIAFVILLSVFLLFNLFYDQGSWGLWALQSIPLLLFVPGLIKHSYRAYSGLSMLILVYFVVVIPEIMVPEADNERARWYEQAVLALSLLIFLSSMYSSRWLQRWHKNQS